MKLIYCYIESFRNIINQEVCLSDEYSVHFDGGDLFIHSNPKNVNMDYLYGNGFLRNLRIVVGKTGSGKTNFLQLLGMDYFERFKSGESDAYVILYKFSDSSDFAAEIVNLNINGLTSENNDRKVFLRFSYDFSNNVIKNVRKLNREDFENTYIINAFDRYAFAHCPYEDKHIESYKERDEFLPRVISQFGKSHVSLECECLQEYLSGFEDGNIKKESSFVICRNNWQDKLGFSLSEKLLKTDYWTYKSRADEQRNKNIKKGKFYEPVVFPEKSTPKTRFIHDLMTDFAIYLRKQAECVDPDFPEKYYPGYGYVHDLKIKNPRVLPDGKKMSVLKRINWLCQYIDYHTDEMMSNRGLVWQIGMEICDLFYILNEMDDMYFTDEQFSIPVMDIMLNSHSPMDKLFEHMGQYRPDEVGIFTQQLLPYHWTHVSSGEYQYAKIWGILEEYGVRVKIISQGQSYKDAVHPNIILLLDEPESYMHPEMCRCFISHMASVLKRRTPDAEFQVILSTHSPFMLSDVISSQVIKMSYDNFGKCIIKQDARPYFAANIHSIIADGFFLQYTIGEQARSFIVNKIALLNEMITRKDKLSEQDNDEIDNIINLIPQIGDNMISMCLTGLIKVFR